MPLFTDQTGFTIELRKPPERIISLVPSQTELLSFLGLNKEVAGITKFCVHPSAWFIGKQKIGGTKTVNINIVSRLQPDLIIANKEENTKEDVETLRALCPVWVSDIHTLTDALEMVKNLGEITNRPEKAGLLMSNIESAFEVLSQKYISANQATAYLIWRNPYMAAGGQTFIHDMMNTCGFKNIFENQGRYPVVTTEEIRKAGCELLLLSSEPFPFKQKHIDELQQVLPDAQIMLVDGEMFSWYGSRLIHASSYFEQLLKQLKKIR
ncbi:MAG: helical backbone metal receptor [Chitinophagaceae bacterium]